MGNGLQCAFACTLSLCSLYSCTTHTTISYTYKVSTGDNIEVSFSTHNPNSLQISNDYDLTGYVLEIDGCNFIITKDDVVYMRGVFMDYAAYMDHEDSIVEADPFAETWRIIRDTNNAIEGIAYENVHEDGTIQYDYAYWLNGYHTGIVLYGTADEALSLHLSECLGFTVVC